VPGRAGTLPSPARDDWLAQIIDWFRCALECRQGAIGRAAGPRPGRFCFGLPAWLLQVPWWITTIMRTSANNNDDEPGPSGLPAGFRRSNDCWNG
jgi:hypothetical protein